VLIAPILRFVQFRLASVSMPRAQANGIEIEYETFGDKGAPPIVLVRGLSTQLIHWDPELCGALADRGLFVVIFDNRDVGLSSWFDDAGLPDMDALFGGGPLELAYGIDDMADDTVGLLDALGVESAHLAGMSMGGMIVQTAAIRHPGRVRTMTSVMSSSGAPELPPPTPEAMNSLFSPSPTEREAYVEHTVKGLKVIGSPGFPFDVRRERARAGRAYDRAFHPDGVARQLAAVGRHGDRRPGLAALQMPALVIHGADDPLIPLEHGKDTASTIPGAELHIFEGMGHDIPPALHRDLVDVIAEFVQRADGRNR
jgi:pimeloyl-ACP methyl ester carboxylesterase